MDEFASGGRRTQRKGRAIFLHEGVSRRQRPYDGGAHRRRGRVAGRNTRHVLGRWPW